MSYPEPEQIENCGPEEARKLAEEFVKIKQSELRTSAGYDEPSFLYLTEQNALLTEKFREYQEKLQNMPSAANSMSVRRHRNHRKFLEILGKVKTIREKHKVFQNKKNEAIQKRRDAQLGLASFQKRLRTEGENANLILQEMWADGRFTSWSEVMFSQLEEEWLSLNLIQGMDRCLVEIETLR